MVKSIYEITECPDCASQNIIYNEKSMQIICKDCGLIYDPLKPVKEVRFGVLSIGSNNEKIIRPAEKKPVLKRIIPKKAAKPAAKKAKPKAKHIKKKPPKRKTMKKPARKPARPSKRKLAKRRTIGARVRGLVKRLIRRR